MKISKDIKNILKELMQKQGLAVLATIGNDQPYTNLVAFVVTDDLRHIFFATPRFTRKYSNLQSSKNASMLIDDRSNNLVDFKDAVVVNAMGKVEEVEKSDQFSKLYLEKHPHLKDFLISPTSALMRMQIEKYVVASSFQNVTEVDMQ